MKLTLLFLMLSFFTAADTYSQLNSQNTGTVELSKRVISGITRKNKTNKYIEEALSKVEINGQMYTILRMRDGKIVSNARGYILKTQQALEEFREKYRQNLHINTASVRKNIEAIIRFDPSWPAWYYEREVEAYEEYDILLSASEKKAKDAAKQNEVKQVADTLKTSGIQ